LDFILQPREDAAGVFLEFLEQLPQVRGAEAPVLGVVALRHVSQRVRRGERHRRPGGDSAGAPDDPAEQTTGEGVPSIFWEDRNLMTVRAKRLAHPRAWSQKTAWGTNHVIGNVTVEKEDANGDLVVRSRFHMMEFRNDTTRHFAGSYIHHLKKTKGGHRIKLQRVDMVNAEGPYEYVLQAWV